MAHLACPSCGAAMKRDGQQDMTVDACPDCGGVFLDKGELDALATGMAGDIDYCSIDEGLYEDKFPRRSCPRCPQQPMGKINLLGLSDIIFDYCPNCNGFFLDKGEVRAMNRELRTLTPSKAAEEYRAMHGPHLVRIDQRAEIVQREGVLGPRFTPARHIRVSVFFGIDMPGSMRLFQEAWPMKLAKAFGLFWGEDIETGDEDFDVVFRVQGRNQAAVARHLDPAARASLLSFVESGARIFTQPGTLEITSTAVVYVEGPYIADSVKNVVESSQSLIASLVDIADRVEAVPA